VRRNLAFLLQRNQMEYDPIYDTFSKLGQGKEEDAREEKERDIPNR
jgi:hypothetical protein